MNATFHLNGKVTETERLILRPLAPGDLEDLYEYASVPGVGEMAGRPHHESREETERVLERFITEDITFAVCLKENGKVIGSLGVELYGAEDRLTEFSDYVGREIGYALSRDYRGRGLMPEAVTAVIGYLFGECRMDFLLCGYLESNAQSKRVQEKCGFVPYRKLTYDTLTGEYVTGILNLLVNPEKPVHLAFSHPETLIYRET